ncbi:MAG: DUF456 domain-containing protein [Verrucomicrobia bacterium]|nr:DUF456 domain-containing protein [Verrucomicrobiota bacterium]
MSWDQWLGLALTLGIMGVGLLGCVLPALPGTPLVFAAALAHRLWFGSASATTWVLVILGVLMAASIALDLGAGFLGAKKLGATWKGALGAGVGGLIGLFFSVPGILLGPFIGAVVFEMFAGREWKEASRAGLGAALGLLAGAVGKFACSVAMITLFAGNVVWRAWS